MLRLPQTPLHANVWLCHHPLVQQCPYDQIPHVLSVPPTCAAARSLTAARRRATIIYLCRRAFVQVASQHLCATRGTLQPGAPVRLDCHTSSTAPAIFQKRVSAAAHAPSQAMLRSAMMPGQCRPTRVFVTAIALLSWLLSWLQRCAPCKPPGLTQLLGRAPRPAPLGLLVLGRPGRARV